MRYACCGGCVLEHARKEVSLPPLKTLARGLESDSERRRRRATI
jgi:hypothetical protein